MTSYPLIENEAERLAKLHSFRILDSLPEDSYDRIVRLAAKMLDVPIALVSLVDADRQWFKARIGLDVTETSRDLSFCAHAICQDGILQIEDTHQDDRFADNPLVTGAPGIRFYAGVPLSCGPSLNIGTLCIIDTKPRRLDEEQKQTLTDLAALVSEALEMRTIIDRNETTERRFIDAIESLPNGFVLYDKDDRLVICNERYREIYAESAPYIFKGAKFEDIIRKGVANGQYPAARGREEEWIAERMEMHHNPSEPIEQHLPGDKWLRVQESRTSEGGLVGYRIDITKLKHQERELARLAWTDSLTGAMNRHRFMELSQQELDRAFRHEQDASLLLIDADHFKSINDNYGHGAGDAVLIGLVERWNRKLRSHDLVGRIGGEEFCILLPQVGASGVAVVAERLRQAIAELPFEFEGQLIRATISIGVAAYTPGESLAGMMKRADTALYQAKDDGRDQVAMSAA